VPLQWFLNMGNVRQYFESDFKGFFWYEGPFPIQINDVEPDPPIMCRVLHHRDSRASCVAFYIPAHAAHPEVCRVVINSRDWWMNARDGLKIYDTSPGLPPYEITSTVFTGRLIIYLEGMLTIPHEDLTRYAESYGIDLVIRDSQYAADRDAVERPHAFISHDARDKDAIARPLASVLSMNLCRVWYDEYSIIIGDSLRASIEDGLKSCHRCVLLLTPNFLSNTRWAKREYDSIFTREIVEGRHLLLPVWSAVTQEQVYAYSPMLADRSAAIWDGDVEKLARQLLKVLL
jgi:hypothetical protein